MSTAVAPMLLTSFSLKRLIGVEVHRLVTPKLILLGWKAFGKICLFLFFRPA